MRSPLAAALLTALVVSATLPSAARADQSDSAGTAEAHNPHEGQLMLAFAGATAMILFAPPAMLLFPDASDASLQQLHGSSFFVYSTGGMTQENETTFGAWSGGFELFQNGFTASYRHTALAMPDPLAYDDVRIGVSLDPARRIQVGAALGYRAGTGRGARDGFSISLPARAGNDRGEFYLEPTYLISETGVSWSYSGRILLHVLGTPIWSGVTVDAQSLRTGGDIEPIAGFLLGLRY